ncbi:uncharacterized protein LOC113229939 [Hyposmocoma kahamanoa]|uniref:uncharacterized protein LOC113229939 n=1 Tax=Hyposmocoma kahamanoa TaxID=1477025 RepID=UPI000E6DA002|nr:uncharacterized protein LOC113229939 [Hyposmocoma kahamanoa]
MGAIGSKDTRRISFDNTFAFNTALAVQTSMQDEHDVLDIDSIAVVTETKDELRFPDNNKCLDLERQDCETDYWGNRIDYLKKEHRVINKIIESEYEKTLQNTGKLLEPSRLTQEGVDKMKSCFDLRNKTPNVIGS